MRQVAKQRTIEEDFIFQLTTKLRVVEMELLLFRHQAIDSPNLSNFNAKLLNVIQEFEPN